MSVGGSDWKNVARWCGFDEGSKWRDVMGKWLNEWEMSEMERERREGMSGSDACFRGRVKV